jgi:hypothetical protein
MTINKNNHIPKIISYDIAPEEGDTEKSITKRRKNNDGDQQKIIEKPRLILHFDINETILIGDDAGGDTVDDCLNKIIAKSAFVKIPSDVTSCKSTRDILPVQWWDGKYIRDESTPKEQRSTRTPSPPPLYTGWKWPNHTCPYYRTSLKKRAKQFTLPNQDGEIYRPLYEHLKLQIPRHEIISGISSDKVNHNDDSQSVLPRSHPFFRMIPSFFHALVKLQEEGREYTLVLRTFGSDLEDIALAISDFASGKHPLFPNFYEQKLILDEKNLFKGRWRRSSDTSIDDNGSIKNDLPFSSVFDLLPWECDERDSNDVSSKPIASGDDQVINIIEQANIIGINDDYHYWDRNNNAPWSAKPVWIHDTESCTNGGKKYHHIFFDDNIHNDANDSIVAVRKKIDKKWVSLTGSETISQHGRYIFRVPTVEVLLNNEWFYEKICNAEAIINDD